LLVFAVLATYIILWLISRYTSYSPPSAADDDHSQELAFDPSSSKSPEAVDSAECESASRPSSMVSARLSSVSVKSKADEKKVEVRSDMLLISGRLIVGWAWQQFLSSSVSEAFPQDTDSRLWYTAIVKCFIAFFVTVFGAYVFVALESRKKTVSSSSSSDKEDKVQRDSGNHDHGSNASKSSSYSEGLRVPLLEANDT
jgi:hypothetical protein